MTGKKVLVVGASGVLGAATAAAFEAAGWRVRRGSRGGGDVHVDLDVPDTVHRAIHDVDLVVNTVPHPALTVERAALDAGATLLTIALLEAAGLRGPARGTVVLHGGRVPGLTNLVAADLVARHPDADAVTIAATFATDGSSGPAGGASVHRMLTGRRHHRTAVVPLPAPFGRRRLLELAEDEHAWLPDDRAARFLVTFGDPRVDRALRIVNALRLCRTVPRSMFVRPATAAPLSAEPSVLRISVERRGTELAARTIRVDGGYRATALATVAQGAALLDPRRTLQPGVYRIEEVLTLNDVLPGLAEAGGAVFPAG